MEIITAVVIVSLIVNLVIIFLIGGFMVRIKNIEKISKDMVTLVGKSAMVNMGYGGAPPTPSHNDVKTPKNDRTNPLVG